MEPNTDRWSDVKIDGLVHEALTCPPGVTERLVATALARGQRPPAGTRVRLVLATAAAIGLVALVVGRPLWTPDPAPSAVPRGELSNEGAIIIFSMPGSPTTLIGPNADALALPAGTVSIELMGEAR
ncbi:MAG: hypothetical protein NT151_11215 [Acidobacteria bacterium]|nr:hypothetical protein [Acidobacteriota bacterium]